MTKSYADVYFYLPLKFTLIDLAGAVQVFQEAIDLGHHYHLHYLSNERAINDASGLSIANLIDFKNARPQKKDIIIICGVGMSQLELLKEDQTFFDWLQEAHQKETTICSICTGAFLLAKSGLLNNRKCTTHWKAISTLKANYPSALVEENVLFTKDENVYTSAGVATGIDLTLFLIEERHGVSTANTIAKELVIYRRRAGADAQESIYLQNRNHHNTQVHIVQDWIVSHLEKPSTIDFLASLTSCSPRSLTRIFKKQTGLTIAEYRNKLRVEKAKSLIMHTDYKIEHIAELCGFNTSKQLRVLLEKELNTLPSKLKQTLA